MDWVDPERRRYLVWTKGVDERRKAVVRHIKLSTQYIGNFV
jgi:hypothetical protein